ncbi:MAG: polysaccharide deacetylase family protein [Candidatus Rokuibacteriota bacterium]
MKRALHSTGGASGLARRDGASFILAAHVVREEEAEELAEIVRLLRRTFVLVSLDEYLDALRAGTCRNLVTLTFDNGLRNQLTVAHDVLCRLRVPATFYVCPALVGTPLSTWTWELEPRLSRMPRRRRRELFAGVSTDSFEPFLRGLKQMPPDRREAIWTEIVSATPDFAFTLDEERRFRLMDWAELAKLDRSLITIGSHTHTHVDLPYVDDERLERELVASKAMLWERLGCHARHFAYPNGSHDRRSAGAVSRHFDSGVTMEPRAVGSRSEHCRLPRVHIQWGAHELAWTLARAARD